MDAPPDTPAGALNINPSSAVLMVASEAVKVIAASAVPSPFEKRQAGGRRERERADACGERQSHPSRARVDVADAGCGCRLRR